MGFQKGHAKVGGRPKGGLNRTTVEIRSAILEAFEKAGGVKYLVRLAEEHPPVFAALLGKVIPQEIKAALAMSGGVELVVRDLTGAKAKPQVIEANVLKGDG